MAPRLSDSSTPKTRPRQTPQQHSVRAYVLEQLRLPTEWRQIGEQRLPDNIDRTTVVVKHSKMVRLKSAPIGHLEHEIILGIFVPNKDIRRAEDALDAELVQLLARIDAHPAIVWEEAEKVTTPNDQFLGWEVSLKVTTTTPTTNPKEG